MSFAKTIAAYHERHALPRAGSDTPGRTGSAHETSKSARVYWMLACRMHPGATVRQYRIASHLGRGGMGNVFLAEDTKLGRKVALKVLSHTGEARETLRSLVREARSASALDHSNVARIYDVCDDHDPPFLVMEYVEGQTLKERIATGPVPVHTVLQIGKQLADALTEAEVRHIVHRDIKPANVLLDQRGNAKLADFGVALVRHSGDATATAGGTGQIIGTLDYMSPEVLSGGPADHRSDIFSLGVVLYESATGVHPFSGRSPAETISRILTHAPARLTADNRLAAVIARCLEKNPERRYASAADLLNDLNATSMPAAVPTGRRRRSVLALAGVAAIIAGGLFWWMKPRERPASIAVLPFEMAQANPELEYLGDGIAETLIYELASIPQVKVASRNSSFRFKNKSADAANIARSLGVSSVLTGRIVERGGNLTLTVELIDAEGNTALWGNRYDEKLENLVRLRQALSRDIVERLRGRLKIPEVVTQRQTSNATAYQLYLRGRFHMYVWNPEDCRKAIQYFTRAVETDPGYALAHAALAETYIVAAYLGDPAKDTMSRARVAALAALRIDSTLGEAYSSLALVKYHLDWDWAGAEVDFRKAMQLSPRDAMVRDWFAWYLVSSGKFEEALSEFRAALALDPMSVIVNYDVAAALSYLRRWDQAREQLNKTLSLDPSYTQALASMLRIQVRSGEQARVLEVLDNYRAEASASTWGMLAIARLYADAGRPATARELLGLYLARQGPQPSRADKIASIYAALHEHDKAFEWLELAFEQRSPGMTLLKADLDWDNIRSDPRFISIIRRMGLPAP
jgi:TolB-like protein/Tfp pilus assembly protein PilF